MQETAAKDSTITLPAEWSTYYFVLLKRGPNYSEKKTSDSLKSLMGRHIQYQLWLQKEGRAIAGGGFGVKDEIIGMTLLCVDSFKEAEHLAKSDPAVKAGWYRVTVHPWYVPAGRIE